MRIHNCEEYIEKYLRQYNDVMRGISKPEVDSGDETFLRCLLDSFPSGPSPSSPTTRLPPNNSSNVDSAATTAPGNILAATPAAHSAGSSNSPSDNLSSVLQHRMGALFTGSPSGRPANHSPRPTVKETIGGQNGSRSRKAEGKYLYPDRISAHVVLQVTGKGQMPFIERLHKNRSGSTPAEKRKIESMVQSEPLLVISSREKFIRGDVFSANRTIDFFSEVRRAIIFVFSLCRSLR
jgi:hypothetical protein